MTKITQEEISASGHSQQNINSDEDKKQSQTKEKKGYSMLCMRDGRIKGNVVSSFPNDGNWKEGIEVLQTDTNHSSNLRR